MSASFCRGCGNHVALVPSDRPGVLVAMEYERDGYTPSTRRHCCPPAERSS